ncbi:DNA polymerase III subunit gamma/tau [[Mycoplasma] falconis]|uniref:DNA polymerase III subunit gamma/tau n=1 Tax=[Mycoplasma] falconis TaxID=92403 RepID=A0A501X9G5_9BACT|nr:DNA polymerase III subunit gamma/tau [[Mycoplasma] falconis]TPE57218.1 DNA polymerase III subunit gamma/tau [[Mycoplasma] falconis]
MSLSDKYLALYRQYRPKRFDDIKGQDHIVATLKNVILNNKISHAYLFCGSHGNGKTSTAKVFANTINCQHNENDPLNPCSECINNIDRNLDIVEIDAASNTGIDDIRDLKEKIKHLPTSSKYKIYIIDEVHMLSKGAFNALLKTLEEPPKHAIFILATTDPQKIPATILSRVQRYNFKKMTIQTLMEQLKNIFDKENITCSNKALKMIAELGNGSFRDTLSIADQVAIYCGNKTIDEKSVEDLFGISDVNKVIELINLLNNHDLKKVIELARDLIVNGIDIERFVYQMIAIIKDFLVYKKTNNSSLLEIITSDEFSKINLDEDKAYHYLEVLNKSIFELKQSDILAETFELILIKLSAYKSKYETVKHQVESPLILEEDADFVVNENFKEPEIKQNNSQQLNSFLDLNSIANKLETKDIVNNQLTKIEDIDINDKLEKTTELLIDEVTSEYDAADIVDNIITSDLNDEDFVLVDESKKDILNPSRLSLDQILDLINVYRRGIKEGKFVAKTDEDKLKYANAKNIIEEDEQETYKILKGFNILFSCEEFVLLGIQNNDVMLEDLNKNAYQKNVVKLAKKIFGRFVHLFAISKEEFSEAKEYWNSHAEEMSKRQYPFYRDLSKEYDEVSLKNMEFAKSAFGDILKIKK